ncbi:competence type IV pilus minor pilin ComGF [Metabacillus sp. Hm71]|uniref:competence type IV pilus minor pilin ComGF n=1 Tax=Metabacillus sp. Hm71 TaxID=3450743 RepID=UPI003F43242D
MWLHNEKGYTFLNLILSFFIYSIIITSLSVILHFLLTHSQHSDDLKPFEWELFVIQLQKELNEAKNLSVKTTEITFTNNEGKLVSVHYYPNMIRRQVYGTGHELFLLKVKTLEFKQVPSGIQLSLVSKAGNEFQYTFRFMRDRA